jgi:hypothetical protein
VLAGSRANTDFHPLFSNFIDQVTMFWRDKRVSDVIRERAYDPSFGSIAVVRRAAMLRGSSADSMTHTLRGHRGSWFV